MWNNVLNISAIEKVVAYADDILMIFVRVLLHDVDSYSCKIVNAIEELLEDAGLAYARTINILVDEMVNSMGETHRVCLKLGRGEAASDEYLSPGKKP